MSLLPGLFRRRASIHRVTGCSSWALVRNATGIGRRNWRGLVPLALAGEAAIVMAPSIDPRDIRLSAAPYFPRPEYALQAEGRLVEVSVVVRVGDGHAVSGLKKSDFEVRDNGKRHETTVFSVQSVAPAGTYRLCTQAVDLK